MREQIKPTWLMVIHELIPKNERLAAIRLTATDRCCQCERPDTLQHRLTECNKGKAIWTRTRARKPALLRMDSRRMPVE